MGGRHRFGVSQKALGHFPPRTSPTCQLSGAAVLQATQESPGDLFCHHGDGRSHLPSSWALRGGDSCCPAPWPGEGLRRCPPPQPLPEWTAVGLVASLMCMGAVRPRGPLSSAPCLGSGPWAALVPPTSVSPPGLRDRWGWVAGAPPRRHGTFSRSLSRLRWRPDGLGESMKNEGQVSAGGPCGRSWGWSVHRSPPAPGDLQLPPPLSVGPQGHVSPVAPQRGASPTTMCVFGKGQGVEDQDQTLGPTHPRP